MTGVGMMRVNAGNDADHDYRIVRKSDGKQVDYVTEADTSIGVYKRVAKGDDGRVVLTHRIAREIIAADGSVTRYDDEGNECGEPALLLEEVREPFQIVHARTREVISETAA